MKNTAGNNQTAYTPESLNALDKDSLITIILGMQDTLLSMQENLAAINERLAVMNVRQFGRSADRVEIPGQMQVALNADGDVVFFNETEAAYDPGAETEDMEPAESMQAPGKPKVKRIKGCREEKLKNLPVKVIPHEMTEEQLSETFGQGGWKRLPDEIQRRYYFVPASLGIEEHHIGVYASKKNDGRIVKADHPRALLKGSLVSAQLEAAVINSKFTNAATYYRIEEEFRRYGVEITRADMAGWTIRCTEKYLAILYDYMRDRLVAGNHVIHADETHVLVNRDGRPAGAESRMWVYRSCAFNRDAKIVLYDYQKTRKASHPEEFLKGFGGICVTDGYQVYHTLEKRKENLKIAGCWYHARRKFTDVIKASKKLPPEHPACKAVAYIKAISDAETKLKELEPEERLAKRQISVRPLVDAYFAWLKDEAQFKVSSSSETGKAVAYSLNQEKFLRVFLEDGDVPMSNNAAESSIRDFVIGRKNFVMIDTVNGANASAMIYSIVETAKANNLKIYEYFEYLLTEIPKHLEDTDRSFCKELAPWSPDLPNSIRKPVKK